MRFCILFFSLYSFVFSNSIDSLKNVVASLDGKEKYEKLIELAEMVYGENDSLAHTIIDEAVTYAQEENEPIILMKARCLKGDIYFHQSNYRMAGEEYKNSLILAEKHDEKDYLFDNCRQLGSVFYYMADYKTASIFLFKSLDLARSLGDEIKEADILNDLGTVYDEIKDYERALENYNQALSIFQKNQKLIDVANVYNNIAITQSKNNELDISLENFEKALNIYKNNNELVNQAIILNNMASIEMDKQQYDLALQYLNQSNDIFKEKSDNYGVALNNYNYGKVYFFKKNYGTSEKYLDSSLSDFEEMGVPSFMRDNYKFKARVDSAQGDYKNSYENLLKYVEFDNEINEESKQREIYEIRTKYDMSQKEKHTSTLIRDNEISRLEIEKQKQINNFFIVVFVLLIGISYLAYRSFNLKTKNEALLQDYSQKIEALNSKLVEEIEKTKRELNESNEKLRKAEKEAARMDKLVSLGTMVAGITHEIKNPTQVIKISMDNIRLSLNDLAVFIYELIKSNKKNGKKGLEDIKKLIEKHNISKTFKDIKNLVVCNKKSVELIDQIVTSTSKISYYNRETTDNHLNDIINDVLVIIRNSIKYSANIQLKLDPELPKFKCNYQEMAQILINLLTNARDAITAKEMNSGDGFITIITGTENDTIYIEVQDNGTGISTDQIEKSFEPFYTTKPQGQGQGLGLSIVKSIVDIYGGLISVKSELGEGTSFRINFPVIKAASALTEDNKKENIEVENV